MLKKIVGSFFRGKVERLNMAFAVASAPFYAEIKSVKQIEADHQKLVDAGKAQWEETTDDGGHYDYGSELGERLDDAEDSLQTLRRAFTFLIYHQWERTTQRWAISKSPNHEDLVKGANSANIPLDEPGLDLLRLLVNTLKHNSNKCGPDLHTRRPDLFDPNFNPKALNPITGNPWSVIDWAERIVLSDANIEEFVRIVSGSVPR